MTLSSSLSNNRKNRKLRFYWHWYFGQQTFFKITLTNMQKSPNTLCIAFAACRFNFNIFQTQYLVTDIFKVFTISEVTGRLIGTVSQVLLHINSSHGISNITHLPCLYEYVSHNIHYATRIIGHEDPCIFRRGSRPLMTILSAIFRSGWSWALYTILKSNRSGFVAMSSWLCSFKKWSPNGVLTVLFRALRLCSLNRKRTGRMDSPT